MHDVATRIIELSDNLTQLISEITKYRP